MPPRRKPQKRFLSKDGPTPAERRWRPVVEEWRRSGQDIAAFCRQCHVPISSLKFWKKELPLRDQKRQARRAASEASRNAMQLLPVRVLEPAGVAAGSVEVVLRGGRVLRIGADFDPAVLQKLVLTLEEAR
jgi:hypothetical protein